MILMGSKHIKRVEDCESHANCASSLVKVAHKLGRSSFLLKNLTEPKCYKYCVAQFMVTLLYGLGSACLIML